MCIWYDYLVGESFGILDQWLTSYICYGNKDDIFHYHGKWFLGQYQMEERNILLDGNTFHILKDYGYIART